MKAAVRFSALIILAAVFALLFPACNNGTTGKITILSIFVAAPPAKQTYTVGETLNTDGLVVIALYSNASTAEVTDYDLSGFDSETAGRKTVFIEYDGKTTEFTVQVVGVTKIEITSPPKNAKCAIYEEPDLTGLVVTASYSDGTVEIIAVTMDNITGFDRTKTGEQTLAIIYGGASAEFTVTVVEVSRIEISGQPAKTEYRIGDLLDITGLEIQVHYSDGPVEAIAVSAGHITGFDSTRPGLQTAVIAYGGKTASFNVTIIGLSGIAVTRLPDKTEYRMGEQLNLAGLEVTARYSDGVELAAAITPANITGFNSASIGVKTVIIVYAGETASFAVRIVGIASGNTVQDKLAWLQVNAASGNTYILEVAADEELAPHELYYAGRTDITIILKGNGNGGEKILSSSGNGTVISVGSGVTLILENGVTIRGGSNNAPLVSVAGGGEMFMRDGAKITGNSNPSGSGGGVYVGTGGTFDMSGGEISDNAASDGGGVYTDTGGIFILTGGRLHNNTGNEVSGTGTINVSFIKIDIVSLPDKMLYLYGDPLDISGLAVTASYINNSTIPEPVAITDDNITGFNPGQTGEQILTITYDGKTASFTVSVVAVVFFDPSGGSWNGSYDSRMEFADAALNYTVIPPAVPSPPYSGAHFAGWFTGGDEEWVFTDSVPGSITLAAKWQTLDELDFGPGAEISNTFSVTSQTTWNNAVRDITNGGNDKNYVINVTVDFSRPGITGYTFGAASGIKVAIRGTGSASRRISLSTNNSGYLLYINAGQTVIMRDLTLYGLEQIWNGVAPLVRVDSGTFEMKGTAVLDRNTYRNPTNNRDTFAGGIQVYGGTFIMRDSARISRNRGWHNWDNPSYGGGVYLASGAVFKMYGGSIAENHSSYYRTTSTGAYGGGVYVGSGSTFEMHGGVISGNKITRDNNATGGGAAQGLGGGVYVHTGGTFRVAGGTIYGNAATIAAALRNVTTSTGQGAALYSAGATQYGAFVGGVWKSGGSLSTTNSTIRVVNGILQ